MAQARRKTRTARPRPKTPARVTKRKRKRARNQGHDAELIGLGLIAIGIFLSCVLWFGLNGGPVPGAVRSVLGWAAFVVPVVLVPIGALMVTRSSLVAVGPFKLGLSVTVVGL